MTESEKVAAEVAENKQKESKFVQDFVNDALKRQNDMGMFGLGTDILNSYLRRTHNHCLLKEAKSRVNALKEADIDLGSF